MRRLNELNPPVEEMKASYIGYQGSTDIEEEPSTAQRLVSAENVLVMLSETLQHVEEKLKPVLKPTLEGRVAVQSLHAQNMSPIARQLADLVSNIQELNYDVSDLLNRIDL